MPHFFSLLPPLLPLAQTTQSFDAGAWELTRHDAFRVGGIAAAVLVIGLILLLSLRKYILRARLSLAAFVALIAVAIYFAATADNPELMFGKAPDYLSYWLRRILGVALVFVGLRILDRLVIVPVLTRGGKVPVQRFIHQVINIIFAVFAILAFGSYAFEWQIDRFLEGSAVVSIVLGLALQESLGNFFSGLVMQASSPFKLGDWIICAGVEGKVVDMTWRAVTIHTLDDNYVILPNGTVAKEQIINFATPTSATARMVQVGLEYDLPPGKAISVLRDAALETPGVIPMPEPFIFLEQFADSSILYTVKFWIDQPAAHRKIEHAVRANVWYRLKQKGYGIPFPMRTVEHIGLPEKTAAQTRQAADERYDAIAGLWLMAPLTPEQKRAIADGARDLLLSAGQVLFSQDDPGDSFFLIRRGEVDVLVKHQPTSPETKVATLKAGDFFGEMSALTGQPRTATIRAASELACVEIGKDDLRNVFASDDAVMEKISRVIAERNTSREAAVAEAKTAATREQAVTVQQKSLLGRMLSFFSGGGSSPAAPDKTAV